MEDAHTYVGEIEKFNNEEFTILNIDGKSIGIICVNEQFIAYLNVCPHAGAPVCMGKISKMITGDTTDIQYSEKMVLKCPWHGWEFDLLTGISIVKGGGRLVKIPILVKNSKVYLKL